MEINHIHTTRSNIDKISEHMTVFSQPCEPEIIIDLDYAEMNGMIEFIEKILETKVEGDYLHLTA